MKNGSISGYLYYVCIQEPKFKYESTDKEWSVTIAVDAATSKQFTAAIPKAKPKMVSTEDFQAIYKTEPPYPESPLQYMYTIKRSVLKANGEPTADEYAPRVYLEDKSGDNIYDITDTHKVGNGSKGEVFYFEKNTQFGVFPGLDKVKLTKLVAFESNGSDFRSKAKTLDANADITALADVVSDGEVASSPSVDKPDTETPVRDKDLPF